MFISCMYVVKPQRYELLWTWAKVFTLQGLKLSVFSREPKCIFKSYIMVLYIETSTSFDSLQIINGATGELKGALGSRHPLILSPALGGVHISEVFAQCLRFKLDLETMC